MEFNIKSQSLPCIRHFVASFMWINNNSLGKCWPFWFKNKIPFHLIGQGFNLFALMDFFFQSAAKSLFPLAAYLSCSLTLAFFVATRDLLSKLNSCYFLSNRRNYWTIRRSSPAVAPCFTARRYILPLPPQLSLINGCQSWFCANIWGSSSDRRADNSS